MKIWIGAALAALVAGSAQAAEPVGAKTAMAALRPPTGAEAVIAPGARLSPKDAQIVTMVAQTQKYYGAIAISPDEGLLAQATFAATNFHDLDHARAAAVKSCDAQRRKGAKPCLVAVDIVPLGWTPGARIQLSADATAAVEGELAKDKGALAISPETGNWGVATGRDAGMRALVACTAKGAQDCAVVVSD